MIRVKTTNDMRKLPTYSPRNCIIVFKFVIFETTVDLSITVTWKSCE